MSRDRAILRELAGRVRRIADLPEMAQRRALWKRHNALDPVRPMVLCYPEGAWVELLPTESLQCTDPLHRQFERSLREKLFWWDHIRDDNTLEPRFNVPWAITIGDYGFPIPYIHGDDRGSYVWDPPMKDLERDLERLRFRPLSVDREQSARRLERAQDLFGDLLPPRLHSRPWWTVGLTWEAARLLGLEQMMWAMMDQPELLHRLMAFLRDDMLNLVTWTEREGLLGGNDGPGDYVGSGGVGAIDGLRADPESDRPVRLGESWGFAESQETVGISPSMFAEFVLPYQLPLLERFALNCYGCCEGLEHRIGHVLEQVPRLRRVSVAPMAKQEVLAERLAGRFVYSRKPNPAHVCVGFNEAAIREDLTRTLDLAGRQPLELVLKDTHTVENDLSRPGRWVAMAYQQIAHAGLGGDDSAMKNALDDHPGRAADKGAME